MAAAFLTSPSCRYTGNSAAIAAKSGRLPDSVWSPGGAGRAIVGIACEFGLLTTAEGIEDAKTRHRVTESA
ncbi:MAG TPA: hypothetical protein PLS04_14305 [Mycobacterium sp.]|nr:hypothetical protein [Mycobacterium sp.]